MKERNAKLESALVAYSALHEAFKGNDELLIHERRVELQARMRELDSFEWEIYLERVTALHHALDQKSES